MLSQQPSDLPPSAAITSKTAAISRIAAALFAAGWRVVPPAIDVSIDLLVCDHGDAAPRGDMIVVTVGHAPGADGLALSGDESDAALVALFAKWRPPGHQELDRMARAFGRDAMTPLLASLRDELRAALAAFSAGRPCDAHKLAGLTGTIGFADASRAWREQEETGAAAQDAWRATRTAILSINRWLDGRDPNASDA